MKLTSTFLYYCHICFNFDNKRNTFIEIKFNILSNASSFIYNLFKMYAVLESAYQINSIHYHSLLFLKKILWFTFCCSNFDNPCELFSAFEISGNCPVQLAAHGIPCTCPFNPTTIDLPPSVFVVPNFDAGWIPIYPVSRRFQTVFF